MVANQKRICVRFNSLGGTFIKDYDIDLYDANQCPLFSVHPNKDTDVIALQIIPQVLIDDIISELKYRKLGGGRKKPKPYLYFVEGYA